MSRPIQDNDDYDRGAEAFKADDDHLLYQCTDAFRDGYKAEFMEWAAGEYPNAVEPYGLDAYWEAHYDEAVRGMRERLLAKVMDAKPRRMVKAQVAIFGIFNFLLGAATVSILALLFLAPFLMDASEVIGFWKEVF